MKLSAYKALFVQRLEILKANLWFTFCGELAYTANNWAGLASTTFYTIGMLVFIKIIFSNVKIIAGYSYQDMLLLFLMAQFTYYANWFFSMKNIYDLVADVNKGNLDLILTKPVPALYFLSTRNINLLALFREGFPPTLAIIWAINWSQIIIQPVNLLISVLILILGLWTIYVFSFIASLPVFWLGESEEIVDLSSQLTSGNGVLIPLEGYSHNLQFLFGTLIPILLTTCFSTSALLNKSNPYYLLCWVSVVFVIATVLRIKMWNLAIKNYTSASS